MKSYRVMRIVFVMTLLCLAGTVQAEMISNGGFDTGMEGWSFPAGTGGWADSGMSTSPDGPSIIVNLNTWLQTLPSDPLVAGQTYEVSFLACILGTAPPVNEVDETMYTHVNSTANGVLGSSTFHLTSTWEEYSYQFTPANAETGGGYGLAFLNCAANYGLGTDDGGWAQYGIDSVSLTAVPEPSTLVLSIAGLFGMLAYAWRNRK